MNKLEKTLLAVLVFVIAGLLGLLIISRDISFDIIIAFLGVLIGGTITGIVQYGMSAANQRHQLRMAALEKRLHTHQEAYTLWRRLLFSDKQKNELTDVVMECQTWWEENCLFLTSQAREAFRKAYLSAGDHANYLRMHADVKFVKAAFKDVERAGDIIVKGVDLPPIGETKIFDNKSK